MSDPQDSPQDHDQVPVGTRAKRRFALAEEASPDGQGRTLRLSGELHFSEGPALLRALRQRALRRARARGSRLDLDLAGVTEIDGASAALLHHVRDRLRRRRVACDLVGAQGNVGEVMELIAHAVEHKRPARPAATSWLTQLGSVAAHLFDEARALLDFIGLLTLEVGRAVRAPRTTNFRDLWPIMERVGADAVPIVVLISFLVGLVSAAQAAAQLERYGANVFVANLVGISMTRELGPLMTAIVVTGRSGAAFAAEIGSMRVGEEVDALRVMGIPPIRYLAMPRILALLLVMPALVMFSIAFGILGGCLVAVTRLGMGAPAYFYRIAEAVPAFDLGLGLSKCLLFALAIGVVACQQGFSTAGGAAAVGERTTSAVVGTLFMLIVIDACFAGAVGAVGR